MSAVAVVCAAQTYRMEPYAGSGLPGLGGDGGPSHAATFTRPASLALDASGRLYVLDGGNTRIRRIDPNGVVSTVVADTAAIDLSVSPADGTLVAGGGTTVFAVSPNNASILTSEFENVSAVLVERAGSILVGDGTAVYRIAADGSGKTAVASGLPGNVVDLAILSDGTILIAAAEGIFTLRADGTFTPIPQSVPTSAATRLAVDRHGEIYITGPHRVWKIAADSLWTLAGLDVAGNTGDHGPAVAALLDTPSGLATDSVGNVYVADTGNHRIRLLRAPTPPSITAVTPASGTPGIWPRDITLRWTPVFGAESWDVYLGPDPANLPRIATTSEAAISLPPLREGTTYYWFVRTRIPPQSPIQSSTFSFTTGAGSGQLPAELRLLEPRNGVSTLTNVVRFLWQGSNAARYDVYIGDNPNALRRVVSTVNPDLSLGTLSPNTRYFWRVIAVNDVGEIRSEIREFSTGPAAGYPWLIETIAGTILPVNDGSAATDAVLATPTNVASGPGNTIYFVENSRTIRRINSDGRLQTIYTPQIGNVVALAVDSQLNVYVAQSDNVVRITRTGARAIYAGQPGRSGFSGDGGPATQALFNGIASIAVDGRGYLYVADAGNHRVRVIAPNGRIRTYAGTGECSPTEPGSTATATNLCSPTRVATNAAGEQVYIASANSIYRVRFDEVVEVAASDIAATAGLAVSPAGTLFMLDAATNLLRKLEPGGEPTVVAGEPGADGRAFGFAGDGLRGDRARFAYPNGIATGETGEVLIADTYNARIRQLDANGFVSTVGGSDTARGDRGSATSAFLFAPTDVAVNTQNDVYIADSWNNRVRLVSPFRTIDTFSGGTHGSIEPRGAARIGRNARDFVFDTAAGGLVEIDADGNVLFTDNTPGTESDNSAGVYAANSAGNIVRYLSTGAKTIGGLARGRSGEVFISDTTNHRVLRIDAQGSVHVFAGTGAVGFLADGGPAIAAQMNSPRALSYAPDGSLYVAEAGRVRRITTDGRIETVLFENADGLAHDRMGNLFMTTSRSIYAVSSTGALTRIAGRDTAVGLNEGGLALDSRIADPRGLAVSADDHIYFADAGLHLVRRLVPNRPASLRIISGDGQTTNQGQPLPEPLRVRVVGRTGIPVPGIGVRFEIADPSSTVPIVLGTANTNADGQAQINPVIRTRQGRQEIRASVFGVDPVNFTVQVQ